MTASFDRFQQFAFSVIGTLLATAICVTAAVGPVPLA